MILCFRAWSRYGCPRTRSDVHPERGQAHSPANGPVRCYLREIRRDDRRCTREGYLPSCQENQSQDRSSQIEVTPKCQNRDHETSSTHRAFAGVGALLVLGVCSTVDSTSATSFRIRSHSQQQADASFAQINALTGLNIRDSAHA